MKANVKFGTSQSEQLYAVCEAIAELKMPWDKAKTVAVCKAVAAAFWQADNFAGNGMSSEGEGQYSFYKATANITTGEFEVFEQIVF